MVNGKKERCMAKVNLNGQMVEFLKECITMVKRWMVGQIGQMGHIYKENGKMVNYKEN